ncbi:MAG: HD domain-containing protein [Aureispira sp.]
MNYLSNLEVGPQLGISKLAYLQTKLEELGVFYQVAPSNIMAYQKDLWMRHQEPQRYYHNLSHLYNLFLLVEEFHDFIQQRELLYLVIWYHDSIYDPARKDNEERSAQLAKAVWEQHLPASPQKQLEAYILATAKHQPQINTQDERLFLDFDLSILAATPTIYKTYSQAIEQEYTTVYPLELYKKGRQQVLKSFLERPQIYYSKPFIEKYETTARANLTAELQTLQ